MASMRPVSSLDGLIWRTSTALTPTAGGGMDGMADAVVLLQAVLAMMKASETSRRGTRRRDLSGGVPRVTNMFLMSFSFRDGAVSICPNGAHGICEGRATCRTRDAAGPTVSLSGA